MIVSACLIFVLAVYGSCEDHSIHDQQLEDLIVGELIKQHQTHSDGHVPPFLILGVNTTTDGDNHPARGNTGRGKVRNRRRTSAMCTDTEGATFLGMSCLGVLGLLGAVGCHVPALTTNCCATRKLFCETCAYDTPGTSFSVQIRSTGEELTMTCSQILDAYPGDSCNSAEIIHNCCASRAHYCPCSADVTMAAFHHPEAGSLSPKCENIFTIGNLAEQCRHPNLWEKCCKTREGYCDEPPDVRPSMSMLFQAVASLLRDETEDTGTAVTTTENPFDV